jgi:hypothetical protein
MALHRPLLVLALVSGASCTKSDRVPAYVDLASVSVAASGATGSGSSKITDAWVSVDDRLIGVWEVPSRIPVLAEGSHKITVVPAIKRNGQFDDRLRYPFYTSWSAYLDLAKGTTATIAPQVAYDPVAEVWFEDFQDPFFRLSTTEASTATMQRYTPAGSPDLDFIDNSPCGGFVLDQDHGYIRIQTDEDFSANGGPVFLELDHRSDVLITVGVLYSIDGTSVAAPFLYLPPTLRSNGTMPWNKVYLDLSGVFNRAVSNRDFYIEAELPASRSSAKVYLDNIKLVRTRS